MSALDLVLDHRVSAARAWLREFLEPAGVVRIALERRGDWDELRGFRFDAEPFEGLVADHGEMLDVLGASVVAGADEGHDVFVCPYPHQGQRRRQGNAAVRRHVHADIDGPLDLARVRGLGAMAVASGGLTPAGPRGHVYVRLSGSVEPHVHRALCVGLGRTIGRGAEDSTKTGDADVLRPAGTLNHKTDPPRPVEWLVGPDDPGIRTWEPEGLARLLGVGWPIAEPEPEPEVGHENGAESVVALVSEDQAQRRFDGLVQEVASAPAGQGNDRLNWAAGVAGALLAQAPQQDQAEAKERLIVAFLGRTSSRHTRAEALATVHSGWAYGVRNPEKATERTVVELQVIGSSPAVVPELPPDIERCFLHGSRLDHSCPSCRLSEAQIDRYARARAVTLERQATASSDAWTPVDLSEAPDLPAPTMMICEPCEVGGEPLALLRAGMIAAEHGASRSGKTTLAYLAGAQEVKAGNLFLVVDHEMGRSLAKDALLDLGLSLAEIKHGVVFYDDPPAMNDLYFDRLMEAVSTQAARTGRRLTLAAYDSVSRSMGKVAGVSTNDEIHVNAWYDSLPRRVLKALPGTTHLTIDHPGRSDGPEAIGSHAKGAGPDFRLHVKADVDFDYSRGRGRSSLVPIKARGYRNLALNTEVAELVVVEGKVRLRRLPPPDPDVVDVNLQAQGSGTRGRNRERLLDMLTGAGEAGAKKSSLTGEGGYAVPRRAELHQMVREGLVRWLPEPGTSRGQRYWLVSLAPEGARSDPPA